MSWESCSTSGSWCQALSRSHDALHPGGFKIKIGFLVADLPLDGGQKSLFVGVKLLGLEVAAIGLFLLSQQFPHHGFGLGPQVGFPFFVAFHNENKGFKSWQAGVGQALPLKAGHPEPPLDVVAADAEFQLELVQFQLWPKLEPKHLLCRGPCEGVGSVASFHQFLEHAHGLAVAAVQPHGCPKKNGLYLVCCQPIQFGRKHEGWDAEGGGGHC
ncbi:MAG: hypothetical protein MUC59_19380 [Saprospiraceae bacterium]|nr:hypothetical protein [Saprospiraceae bacterium]